MHSEIDPNDRIAAVGPIRDLRRYADIPHYWLGTLEIRGTRFHAECIEVEPDDSEPTTAVNPELQGRIDAVGSFDFGSRYQTARIKRRPHFIVIIPFQQ